MSGGDQPTLEQLKMEWEVRKWGNLCKPLYSGYITSQFPRAELYD